MRDAFESERGDITEAEIIPDGCGFKSAGKKYINQNYKRIGGTLCIEGKWLGNIKRQAKKENKLPDIQGDPSLEQINFYRGHYYFSPLTPDEYAAIKAQNISEEAKGEEVAEEELPVVEALREESDSLINESIQQHNSTEEGGKLARIEGEIHPGEGELETLDKSAEIEQLKQEARQAIQRYKEFGDRHAPNLRTEYVQDIYRQLEKVAWDKVEELSHKLDGHLSRKLPQLRDILTAHRDLTNISDAKNYLLQKGNILVNDEGTITHIVNYEYKGDEVELNHPKTFGEIFNQSRPVRILYRTNKEGKKIGYIIKGLNLNTPDWIEGVLSDKEYLEPVIVDETVQPATPITEAVGPQEDNPDFPPPLNLTTPPWAVAPPENNPEAYADYDWKEDTEVDGPEQIESNPANRAENIITIDVEAEEVAEPKQSEERETTLQGSNPSGNTPENNTETTLQGSNSSGNTPENSTETTPQVSLDDLRLDYARAEEAWNRKRGDEKLKDAFMVAREAYNTELERVLKSKVAEDQGDNIHQIFKEEVIALRDSRTTQSQELQGKWKKGFNNAKEKFLGWATKNKRNWMIINAILFAGATGLSLLGAGVPVAGSIHLLRRSLGSVMAGVGSRNTLVGLMEDRDIKINKFGLNINFQAEVPKIVKESISESEDEIKAVPEDVLKERLGTLEAYYRLNGGEFTKENQKQAYEKVLTELARRVQENVIDAENTNLSIQSSTTEQLENEEQNSSTEDGESDNQYTSILLNTISYTRIAELDKFRRKRQIANVVGVATTGVLGGLLLNDIVKQGGMFRPNIEDGVEPTTTDVSPQEVQNPVVNTDGAGGTETSGGIPTESTPPQATNVPSPEEAIIQAREAAEQAQELAQDVSSLDSGETIWGEITKQLGEDASQAEIQQAVEKYLRSQAGQESIFELAQQTEGGRALLSQWGIYNADAMAKLELKDLYEVSRYLGEGELKGLTKLSLDNLNSLEQVVVPEVTGYPTIESVSTKTPAPPEGPVLGFATTGVLGGVLLNDMVKPGGIFRPNIENSGKPPTTGGSTPDTQGPGAGSGGAGAPETGADVPKPNLDTTPSATEAPVPPPSPEVPPVASTEFTKSLSEALGTANLTDSQIGSILEAYADTEQGRKSLYNLIITSEANNPAISEILDKYRVTDVSHLSDLPANQLNILAQEVGVENLDKLPGFELNEIILSKFKDAPDMVELARGTRPLDVVQRYIANELGNLPYDANLGKQVLDTYLQTDAGKQWLYDAIVSNPNPNNQNVQLFREYLRFKGITSSEEFVNNFNWVEFSGNRNIPTSGFWNQIRLPNGGTKLQPLSTFLQPSQMPGIKEAVRQVLTRQLNN